MIGRLLEVDPTWSMEPLARNEHSLPLFDGTSLWVRLTVAGLTRIGVGDSGSRTGRWAKKDAFSDALRNAGKQFGMALDLWASGKRIT
ncbi:hypothetical protein [Kitasatospora cinereorecta]|uniref:DRBM domain-containing protein n=1 Tax=Kitasatospora cinereorecta TaxID=285560 RepID=A0ABW0VR00_9ACTN